MCLLPQHSCKERRGGSRSSSFSAEQNPYDTENKVREDRISSYPSFVEKLSQPCGLYIRVTRSHRGPALLDRVKLVDMDRGPLAISQLQLSISQSSSPYSSPSSSQSSSPPHSPSSSLSSISTPKRGPEDEAGGGVEAAELRNLVAGIQMMLTNYMLQVHSCNIVTAFLKVFGLILFTVLVNSDIKRRKKILHPK